MTYKLHCLLTTLLVPLYDSVHRFPGRFCDRAPYAKFGSMLCYGFRDLAIGPVTVLELCCDMAYDMICMMI